jgi:hypothetical protein
MMLAVGRVLMTQLHSQAPFVSDAKTTVRRLLLGERAVRSMSVHVIKA